MAQAPAKIYRRPNFTDSEILMLAEEVEKRKEVGGQQNYRDHEAESVAGVSDVGHRHWNMHSDC